MRYSNLILSALVASVPAALGHSWIEHMDIIDETGSFTGEAGFPRNNIQREVLKSNEDIIWRIQNIKDPAFPLCRPEQSKVGAVTDGSPQLKASPGDNVALRYAENGHTTKLEPGRPDNGGIVYIYGTTQPKDNEKLLDIFKVWTVDGKGGDGRGRLLATRNYDDGKCFESGGTSREINKLRSDAFPNKDLNSVMGKKIGEGLWCQTDFTIPADLKAEGSLAVYWVWDWTMTTSGAPPEIYSTCMDIKLVPGPGTSKNLKFSQRDLNKAAIESQLLNLFSVEIPEMGAVKGAATLPGPLPDQGNARERLPADSSSKAADVASPTKAPVPVQPPAEPKSSDAPKQSPTFTPGIQAPAPAVTVTVTKDGGVAAATVTITKDGPVSTVTREVFIAVGSTYIPEQKSSALATSSAESKASSPAVPTTFATKVSSQAAAGASPSSGFSVTQFMDSKSSIIPASPASTPPSLTQSLSSISRSATLLPSPISDTTSTASPPGPTKTDTPQDDEVVQTVTVEATITTSQTITASFVKPLPTANETPLFDNGTVLPRMRRVRRAL